MSYIYPEPLKPGDRVCLIDPANAYTDEALKAASGYLTDKGFEVVVAEDMAFKRGTRWERAERFNRVIRDPKNRGLICVWGGYGTMPLLDLIDYEAIRKNRPVFAGYSDNTALQIAIGKKTGLITYHGPSFYSPSRPTTEEAKEFLVHMLTQFSADSAGKTRVCNLNNEEIEVIRGGCAKGQLVGGNMTLVSRLMGTPYEIDTKGKILFLEEIGEKPYRLHGMMTQLKMAGKLDEAVGIMIGSLNRCDDTERPGSGLLAVKDVLKDVEVPAVCNIRAGHVGDSLTLPLNAVVTIEGNQVTF